MNLKKFGVNLSKINPGTGSFLHNVFAFVMYVADPLLFLSAPSPLVLLFYPVGHQQEGPRWAWSSLDAIINKVQTAEIPKNTGFVSYRDILTLKVVHMKRSRSELLLLIIIIIGSKRKWRLTAILIKIFHLISAFNDVLIRPIWLRCSLIWFTDVYITWQAAVNNHPAALPRRVLTFTAAHHHLSEK